MSAYFPVVIHHNPRCGTSRTVLEAIRAAGHDPHVVDYMETGWTEPQLRALFAAAGMRVRDALREKEGAALLDASEDEILAAMLREPVLVNRPIVATPKGVRLCRPAEKVQELL
jgi:arsenate reductase